MSNQNNGNDSQECQNSCRSGEDGVGNSPPKGSKGGVAGTGVGGVVTAVAKTVPVRKIEDKKRGVVEEEHHCTSQGRDEGRQKPPACSRSTGESLVMCMTSENCAAGISDA